MESFYTIIALLTAGGSLVTGLINLFTGLHKDAEKVDVVFGVMGISLFIFFMIPPIGFITVDKAPYPLNIDIKRLFLWAHYALLPWFIELYTGHKKRPFPIVTGSLLFISYIVMFFTVADSAKPGWVMIVVIALGIILYYGLIAAIKQIKSGRRTEGLWLLLSMIIYGVLYGLGVFNQLGTNYSGKMVETKIFFPFHFNLIAFMILMSMRLRANTFEKYRLEKILRWRDKRWDSLVQNMRLIIVEIDKEGKINYLNQYAAKALGYNSETELLNKNWFETCLPANEAATVKAVFKDAIQRKEVVPFYKIRIKAKDGKERIINWTNVLVYNNREERKVREVDSKEQGLE